ncbi:hypothetical protein [Streptomyces sp. 039-1]|uniref:hypothetical protein n=1 Tax=Streptomyces sp. 039-1 TaxID=2789263 RepID=UPI0039F60AA2
MSPSLSVETPAGTVHATARPRDHDSVVFDLSGAMRGCIHVTGTHHVRHWDQFTAVRACLGPVNAFQEAKPAPDETLPRLASRPALRAAVTAWWTVARWFTAHPHPALLLMLANRDGSLARDIDVQAWLGPYCLTEAAGEHDRARNAEAEAASLRTQQPTRRTASRPQTSTPTTARMENA